jgi:gamma-glutamyltranspeptidase/glutathione hydrolase
MVGQANLNSFPFNSAKYVHLISEVMRRGFANKAEHLGAPDFNLNMPLDRLISKDFRKMRYNNIDFNHASLSDYSIIWTNL